MLVRYSAWFSTLLKGPFKEARSADPILLPEDDVDAWKFFTYWLFYRNLPPLKSAEEEAAIEFLPKLAKLWILADRVGISLLRQFAIIRMCTRIASIVEKYPQNANRIIRTGAADENNAIVIRPDVFLDLLPQIRVGSALHRLVVEFVAFHLAFEIYRVERFEGYLNDVSFIQPFTKAILQYVDCRGHEAECVFDYWLFKD